MKLSKTHLLASSVVSTMLLLAGCGGGNNATTADAQKTDAASTEAVNATPKATAPTPAGKIGVNLASGAEPESLDPHKSSDAASFDIMRQMLIGLTTSDSTGATIPSAAESWTNVDEKVWTFKLRDANWSNGDPLTAHDFVYSLQRLTDPKTGSPYASYLVDAKVLNAFEVTEGKAGVEALGVKALDDKTLEITLSEPVPYFPDLLTLPVTYAVNKKAVETHGDKWVEPANYVVSGAYKLKDWVVNSHITIEKNPSYYDAANTKIAEASFLPVSGSAAVNRYKVDELDVVGVPPEQIEKLKAEHGDEMHASPRLCTFYLEHNNAKAPFDDVRVRRAISLVIDRETLADKVIKRGEKATYQFTPPAIQGMGEVNVEWKAWDKAKRAEEAKKLLTEAGYSAEKPLKFEILYSTSEMAKLITTAASAMIKEELGGMAEASPINQEWKTMLSTRREGKYNTAFAGWCSDYNEPSTFLNVMRSGNSNNTGKYSNPEFDKLLEQTVKAGLTPADRIKLYHEAELIMDKDAAIAPVYTGVSLRLVKPYLQADSLADPSGNYQIKDWELR
ncbi:MAG: ABC transporter substrate-binding protein [Moraxella sp.]|nr:ABC transporter substrate-binding protein [Moraxella sp.]